MDIQHTLTSCPRKGHVLHYYKLNATFITRVYSDSKKFDPFIDRNNKYVQVLLSRQSKTTVKLLL